MASATTHHVAQGSAGYVSAMNKCQTTEACYLCIYDIVNKLKDGVDYDIGGTYSDADPEYWFYCTTTPCHGLNYLLNLFVCHRKSGSFSIEISNSTDFSQKPMKQEDQTQVLLPKTYNTYKFKTVKPDTNHYITTYCFSEKMKMPLDSVLFIPLKITVDPPFTLNSFILKTVKLQHDMSGLMTKQEKSDFTLESSSHKKFPTHKILLAAHSPVLRSMIKNTELTSLHIDISDYDMELLLEFIYSGTIKDLQKQNSTKLLKIADQFELKPLFLLTQHVIVDQIRVDNAIEMAVIAKKYQLEELQSKVFDFIIKNPAVMKTDAWNELNDVELTKVLFQYMHTMKD